MEPVRYYEQVIVLHGDEEKEELDRAVLRVLRRHVGKEARISRGDLVDAIYGVHSVTDDPNQVGDRRVRASIERLREKWVILSSSGSGGYWLPESESEAQDFIAEMESRAMKMLQTTGRMKRNLREQFETRMQMELWGT